MKKTIRACALLLTLCMLLALLPVSAFAATEITVITITGLDAPVVGATPDYELTFSSTPSAALKACRVQWHRYDEVTGEPYPVPEGYRFAAGDVVYAYVQIEAKSGYYFGESNGLYTGVINMRDYDTDYPAWILPANTLGVYSKDYVVVSDSTGEQITAVSVSDLDAPVVGQKPDFDVTVTTEPANALAEYEVMWALYVEKTGATVMLDESHVFAENEMVIAVIAAMPKEGYIFGAPLDVYTGTVNTPHMEETVLHEINADGSMYIYGGVWALEGEPVGGFVDVEKDAWYTHAVLWAVENGVTTGVDETHFAPDEGCTRAQAVTFLWRAAGKPEPTVTECAFEDVDVTQYYYKAVLWAVENGITNGTDATHFEPDTVCTRAHIVTFLYRTLKGTVSEGATNPFVDVPAGEWYTDAVLWAAENGVTNGVDESHFDPEGTCIRSHIVTFIYRAMAE